MDLPDVVAAPDWTATAQTAIAALSWVVTLVSVAIAWSEHRERRRGEQAAREAAQQLEERRIQA
ncbi:MAG TPA: hypothetical protein VNV66_01805, partial [Pilimelia sp.]|nr:hypothetical protein [Pilimelia sp.]